MTAKAGKDCVLLYNSGTYASPTWVVIPTVRDDSMSLGKAELDASARDVDWEQFLAGLKTAEVTASVRQDTGGTAWEFLKDAYLDDDQVDLAVADGPIATVGTQYLRLTTLVFAFSADRAIANTVYNDLTFKPTPDADGNPPIWVEVTA